MSCTLTILDQVEGKVPSRLLLYKYLHSAGTRPYSATKVGGEGGGAGAVAYSCRKSCKSNNRKKGRVSKSMHQTWYTHRESGLISVDTYR